MVILLMKSSSLLLFLLIFTNFLSLSVLLADQCSNRWQMVDKLNIKVTFDWRILSESNLLITEFRTNQVAKGFWYGFSLSSFSQQSINELVYVIQWQTNHTEISWNIYNITKTDVIPLKDNNDTSLIRFQRLISSGLLTVRSLWNVTVENNRKQCRYFVYMRGRLQKNKPLLPDEIRFNRSLCLTCQSIEITSTDTISTMQETTTDRIINQSINDLKTLNEDMSMTINFHRSSSHHREEYKFIWFGRIVNRAWSNDYTNLNSLSSRNLRLDLENLFLFVLNYNSSSSFICNQFEFYSLQSGSILFASNITLISNLSEEQTIEMIEQLIKPLNTSHNHDLHFDQSKHQIKRRTDIIDIDFLFKNLSHSIVDNYSKRTQTNPTLYLIIGSIISIGCLMIIITTILCLYGYYKCRRREFRLHTERQTFKFRSEIDSYRWLGQQPSTSSSSPYLIQSTSI